MLSLGLKVFIVLTVTVEIAHASHANRHGRISRRSEKSSRQKYMDKILDPSFPLDQVPEQYRAYVKKMREEKAKSDTASNVKPKTAAPAPKPVEDDTNKKIEPINDQPERKMPGFLGMTNEGPADTNPRRTATDKNADNPAATKDLGPMYNLNVDKPVDINHKSTKSWGQTDGQCRIIANNEIEIEAKINKFVVDQGKLLKYNLHFENYTNNPLSLNDSAFLNAHRWKRAYTKHGLTLLTLAFNYDMLSLSLLSHGAKHMKVKLRDEPLGCFGELSNEEKINMTRILVMKDFQSDRRFRDLELAEDNFVCNEVVKDASGVASFTYNCCQKPTKGNALIVCKEQVKAKWIRVLYVIIIVIKILFLLFGPLYLQRWMFTENIEQTNYVINLKHPLRKTMMVNRVKHEEPYSNDGARRGIKQFRKFREKVKDVTSGAVNDVEFTQLHIAVNHKNLITESRIPVGVFQCLYETFMRCRLREIEPFTTCCTQSPVGSWKDRFLWLKLGRKSPDCNASCRKYLSWGHIFVALGAILFMAAILIPYYIRVAIYYLYEEKEVLHRKHVAAKLNLEYKMDHNVLQYLSPTHPDMVLLYVFYGVSFILILLMRACNFELVDIIADGAVQDLRKSSLNEGFRMVLAHLILPLEKFGLCGFIIGALYWPIAIPICLLVFACYCLPTLYMIGRFLILSRPSFLKDLPVPTARRRRHETASLSNGVTSFESALLLDSISPSYNDDRLGPGVFSCCCRLDQVPKRIFEAFIGLVCIFFMLSILFFFAEVIGFVVEVLVYSLMGAIVNASSGVAFVMLFFWLLVYCASCYNKVYETYLQLNAKVFEFMKTKLSDDIRKVTLLRHERQRNTAFKYFSDEEKREILDLEAAAGSDSDFDDVMDNVVPLPANVQDSIGESNGRLQWTISSLVLFVDRDDVPRIPRQLFERICDIQMPGCPGPVQLSLLRATRELLYMALFLVFVFVVLMLFSSSHHLSSTNHLMLTLASGFLPFVVRFVFGVQVANLNLNTYSFEGRVHNIIRDLRQVFPVFDLSFRRLDCEDVAAPPRDASHVDLLITVRDEGDDNARLSPDHGIPLQDMTSLPPRDAERGSPQDDVNMNVTSPLVNDLADHKGIEDAAAVV